MDDNQENTSLGVFGTDATVPLRIEDRIRLREQRYQTLKLGAYLRTKSAGWYWLTLLLAVTTAAIVFAVPEHDEPLVYIRYVLGTVFILVLPGYSFVRALFPEGPPFETSSKSLDSIERIALSIGVSLALVPITGLLLNYTPYGIRLTPIVVSLLAMTIILATVGIVRQYYSDLKKNG